MTEEEKAAEKVLLQKVKDEALKSIKDETAGFAKSEEITKLRTDLEAAIAKASDVSAITKLVETSELRIKALEETPKKKLDKGLMDYITENSEVLKSLKSGNREKHLDMTIKATEVATDIGDRDVYATILSGTNRLPVRRTSILDLFRHKKVSTEYIKYREENVVTRDAKFVVACATSTHTTKKSWVMKTVELAKVRDMMDACIDMLDDYAWVESELKELINESIKLKIDYELLLGTSAATTDLLSIDSIASEFNPANALANFSLASGTPFQDANLEQLVDAMGAQISIFGEENAWMADTVIMNFKDFVNYRNLKDANGNKLIHTLSDGFATIAGMRVVTSPIVVADTLYVFDSTQGEILDRQLLTVKTSYENGTNIEHETVTFVAVERLQFHVPIIQRDAFMKCSGVAAAIALITAA